MNKETILIIGAGIYQFPLVEYASKHYRVVLAAPVINESFSKLVDKTLICDVRDTKKILQFAKKEKIDGVITDQTDIAVRSVAWIAEQLGLPGIGLETAMLFTDKSLMRKILVESGISVLPSKTVSDLSDALVFFNELKQSVIIKPLDNQGSRGVQLVRTPEELKQKFEEAKKYSITGNVLIEAAANGREFVVEGLVLNYEYRTLICGDTYYFDIPDAFAANMRCFPSNASDSLVKRVKELNKKIITAFGLKQGITHSEFIMNGDEIYLLETAARGGGVFISSDLISISTGLCTEEFLCNIALGKQLSIPSIKDNLHSCGYMAFYLPDGEVVSTDGIDKITSLPYVHHHLLNEIHVGLKTINHCDKTSRYAIIVSADDRKQISERMDFIRAHLNILSKTENGLKPPIWY